MTKRHPIDTLAGEIERIKKQFIDRGNLLFVDKPDYKGAKLDGLRVLSAQGGNMVELWRGKLVTEMSKEELIVALHELEELYQSLHYKYMKLLTEQW